MKKILLILTLLICSIFIVGCINYEEIDNQCIKCFDDGYYAGADAGKLMQIIDNYKENNYAIEVTYPLEVLLIDRFADKLNGPIKNFAPTFRDHLYMDFTNSNGSNIICIEHSFEEIEIWDVQGNEARQEPVPYDLAVGDRNNAVDCFKLSLDPVDFYQITMTQDRDVMWNQTMKITLW